MYKSFGCFQLTLTQDEKNIFFNPLSPKSDQHQINFSL